MAFQPAPNVLQAQIRLTMPGNVLAENVLHFLKTGYTVADAQDLADAVDGWVGTDLLDVLSTGVTYRETYVKGLGSALDVQATADTNAGAGSVGTSAFVPNSAAVAVKLMSGLTGRSGRGRVFHPLIAPSQLASQVAVDPTAAAAIATVWSNLIDVAATAGFTWGILSRIQEGVPLASAILYPIVNAVVQDLFIDSQRRRLGGRGV